MNNASYQSFNQTEGFIHVETERLDSLLALVGELVINRVTFVDVLQQARDKHGLKDPIFALAETLEQLGQVVKSVQDKVMQSRMVPVEHLFGRFPAMLETLCENDEKKIELTLTGADTEMDKTVIDALSEPLIHFVRNAYDHGIETQAERVAAGKSPVGNITLSAGHENNRLKITISDDGSGLDIDAISKKAVDRGLVEHSELATYSEHQIYDFIFSPRFSTKDKISELSGRGVGMDAARQQIESLGGKISLQSKRGLGTQITATLPLAMAILPGLFFRVADEIFAMPIDHIEETTLIAEKDISLIEKQEVIHLRGAAVSVVRLSELFQFEKPIRTTSHGIIAQSGSQRTCLLVDQLMGRQEIVLKPLSGHLSSIEVVAGATITGDGKVVIVLNPEGLTLNSTVKTSEKKTNDKT